MRESVEYLHYVYFVFKNRQLEYINGHIDPDYQISIK